MVNAVDPKEVMDAPMRGAPWTVCGASVRGASHVRDGLPNQDAIALWTSGEKAGGGPAVVAIADGHGSPRHFRSALGARFAVDESVVVLREFAPHVDTSDAASRSHLAAVVIPQLIVEGWTRRTREHLAAHPLTEDELRGVVSTEGAAAADDVASDPLLAYGATVLAALVTARCVVVTQLGDGDILAVDADGTTTRPLPHDERLIGNLTTSICRAGSESDFRSIVLPRRPNHVALLLSTDGYANSFKSDADFLQVGHDFVSMIGRDGIVAVEKQLEAILQDASNVGSGDDITLGIVQCVDASNAALALAARAAAPAPHPAGDASDPRIAAAESQFRRMRVIALAALVVALGVVGWTWRDHLPDWSKGGTTIAGTPAKIELPKSVGAPKGDHPTKPDFHEPPAAPQQPSAPAVSPAGPKSANADGGIVAPAAPKIEDLRAKRIADGVRVTATVAFDGAPDPACRFEATLWSAKDQRLESGGSLLVQKVATGDHPTTSATVAAIKVETTLALPKDAERAKAMKSKDARYSTAVTCDGRALAESAKQAIDG